MPDAPRPPLQLLDDGEDGSGAGPLDDALFEGVPDHLLDPLRRWLDEYLHNQPGLAERVALRLRYTPPAEFGGDIREALTGWQGMRLLQAVNAALQLDETLNIEIAGEGYVLDEAQAALADQYGIPAWLGGDGYSWTTSCTRGPWSTSSSGCSTTPDPPTASTGGSRRG